MTGNVSVTTSYFSFNKGLGRGGAVWSSSSFFAESSMFVSNYGVDYGGAIGGADLAAQNSIFFNNSASINGGVMSTQESIKSVNNTYTSNRSGTGGALSAQLPIESRNDIFFYNIALVSGAGAIRTTGEAVNLFNSTFSHNIAQNGAGAVLASGPITIQNCTFHNNSVRTNDGGAIAVNGAANLTSSNTLYTYNSASASGGALWVASSTTSINDTFLYNKATNGGALSSGESVMIRVGLVTDTNGRVRRGCDSVHLLTQSGCVEWRSRKRAIHHVCRQYVHVQLWCIGRCNLWSGRVTERPI